VVDQAEAVFEERTGEALAPRGVLQERELLLEAPQDPRELALQLGTGPQGLGDGFRLQGRDAHLVSGADAGEVSRLPAQVVGVLLQLLELDEERRARAVEGAEGPFHCRRAGAKAGGRSPVIPLQAGEFSPGSSMRQPRQSAEGTALLPGWPLDGQSGPSTAHRGARLPAASEKADNPLMNRGIRESLVFFLPLLVAAAGRMPAAGPLPAGDPPSAKRLALETREAAGIRRFGYPVSAELEPEGELSKSTRFRLLLDGAPVPAQFRPLAATAGSPPRVALDFEASFLPFEARRYTVDYGPEVAAGPEPERGLKLEETAEAYRIVNGELAFTIRKDLQGLLASVAAPGGDFVKPGSRGIGLRGRDGQLHPLARLIPRVVKSGPLAVRLGFEGSVEVIMVRVEIEIPRSKSWTQVSFTVEDPNNTLAGLEADLGLNLSPERTLADFGAVGLVYAALVPGQMAVLRGGFPAVEESEPARPFWEVLRGPEGKLEPYVEGPPVRSLAPLEGWAHVMDRDRCTAVAVRDFAQHGEDRLEVGAGRGLGIRRAFARLAPVKKSLVFWLHFVPTPPHVGAVTSPQSMASPIETRWR
jgi:hypothetical protein